MRTAPLEELLDVLIDHRGRTPKKLDSTFTSSGVPVASAQLVSGGVLDLSAARFVDEETWERWMPEKLEAGDVLLTSEAPLGRVAWVRDDRPLVLGQRLFALRAKRRALDARYLGYWLISDAGQVALSAQATGSTVSGIRQSALRKINIPVPKLSVQEGIGALLGVLDEKIYSNRRVVDVGRSLLLARWENVADDFRSRRTIGEIAEVNPVIRAVGSTMRPYIGMKSLPEHGLLVERLEHREAQGGARFQNGDTLLARITPCFENGKMAFIDILDDGKIGCGSTEFIVFRARAGVPKAVPYAITASADFRTHAARTMVGTSGRQRVQARGLEDFEINWPSDDKVAEYGRFSDVLLRRLGAARDENARLAATRDELLPLLMNGKITVKDAEKTVEDVV